MDEKYVYLNLQQQVGKNKADIEELRKVKFNLERAGIRVVGEEASASDLPDPITYSGELGDAYLIGTEPPYDMYVFTQPSVGETNFKWFNLGPFPAGPQGETGPQGEQGPQGDASNWRFGSVNPSILETDKEHDGYLNTTSGMVYEFDGERWIPIGSIKGPQGPQGPRGIDGPQGQDGAKGDQGPQGPAGIVIEVIGVVASEGALPDPSTVQRNGGYIVDDGNTKELYIIVEDENQDLIWYNTGEFTGTAGQAAGFDLASASVTMREAGQSPACYIDQSGPNTARRFLFRFYLPYPSRLSDEMQFGGMISHTNGYTQYVIDKKTPNYVFREPSDLGLTAPVTTQQILSAINANSQKCYSMTLISNDSNFEKISDAPSAKGQLIITQGTRNRNASVIFIDESYNVYIYNGSVGAPEVAQWLRLLTSKDAAGIGTPVGGTTGQILAKVSDDDFDTAWEDVPNAPNGIAAGGTDGQMLIKSSDDDYETEWVDVPDGVPSGGATGQMLVKQSNNDGDTAWQTPPVGLPSAGTTGQFLKKKSATDFDVEWDDLPKDIPSGGTTGQMLVKKTNSDYDTEWQTPPTGVPSGGSTGQVLTKTAGGMEWRTPSGGGGVFALPKNMLINPHFAINQRGGSSWTTPGVYTYDRWMTGANTSTDSYKVDVLSSSLYMYGHSEIVQFVEIDTERMPDHKYLAILDFEDVDAVARGVVFEMGIRIWNGASWSEIQGSTVKYMEDTHQIDKQNQAYCIINYHPLDTVPSSTKKYFQFYIRRNDSAVGFAIKGAYLGCFDSLTDGDITSARSNGTPFLIPPTNYGEEQKKCEYYFAKLWAFNNPISIGSRTIVDGKITNCIFSTSWKIQPMRVSPTKSIPGGLYNRALTFLDDYTEITVNPAASAFSVIYNNGYAYISYNSSTRTNIIPGSALLYLDSLNLDAEIYS